MKRQGSYRWRLALVSVVVAVGLGGGSAKADFTFGEPTNLGPIVNSSSHEEGPYIPPDGLSLYFSSTRSGGHGDYDLWVSKRPTIDDDWASPINLGSEINSSAGEYEPYISSDGLDLYFYSNRSGGYGSYDLWVATRQNVQDQWSAPKNVGSPINSSRGENDPVISADGLEIYFDSNRSGGSGGWDIYVGKRQTIGRDWQNPVNLGPMVNSPADDTPGSITADGLMLFLYSARSGGYGGRDIWVTRRETKNSPWEEPVNLGPTVNSSTDDAFPRISFDGRWLYFSDFYAPYRPGGFGGEDIWQAPIIPIVDFNGDRIVDAKDMCIMVDHWGEDYPLCDIGPMPWGDGIVDVEDLKVLAEYVGEEVDDPTLLAHWALDETAGIVAIETEGAAHGIVTGAAVWQPEDGRVAGALELSGSACVKTRCALNPADGPFSVLAWVKGGSPGQVIISQKAGANWLLLDPATGALMSDLKSGGRSGTVLYSDAIIADGTWHRVSFTWDGSTRSLYVDDVLVAEDAQDKLASCTGGLNIGAGYDMSPDTYWTGLIDDIRIYNRAVKP